MNKDRITGFCAGLLTAVLALGLGGAAIAARTISVDDGISVTINGVPFTPKDVNSKPVPLFVYNGTTYAPIRAFSQAAGLLVDYDAEKAVARVETPDYAARTDPAYASYIGADKARDLALADAGVTLNDARILKCSLDWEDGTAVYEVEFCAQRSEYDYELDAVTGTVLKKSAELPDFDWSRHDDYRIDHGGTAGQATPPDLITRDKAIEIAARRAGVSSYTVAKCELDRDDGVWVYEVELRWGRTEFECDIDAASGAVLKWEKD